jgi:hypothetical protein
MLVFVTALWALAASAAWFCYLFIHLCPKRKKKKKTNYFLGTKSGHALGATITWLLRASVKHNWEKKHLSKIMDCVFQNSLAYHLVELPPPVADDRHPLNSQIHIPQERSSVADHQ